MSDELVEKAAEAMAKEDPMFVAMLTQEELLDLARAALSVIQQSEPVAAYQWLRENQQQADMDGCMVTVSRQALDELLDAYQRTLTHPASVPSVTREQIAAIINPGIMTLPRINLFKPDYDAAIEKAEAILALFQRQQEGGK